MKYEQGMLCGFLGRASLSGRLTKESNECVALGLFRGSGRRLSSSSKVVAGELKITRGSELRDVIGIGVCEGYCLRNAGCRCVFGRGSRRVSRGGAGFLTACAATRHQDEAGPGEMGCCKRLDSLATQECRAESAYLRTRAQGGRNRNAFFVTKRSTA